jgi:hypothetical protein
MSLHENDYTDSTDSTACIDYVVSNFPFRIQSIRTDRGHEFQALFHWHVADPCRNTSTSNRERHSAMGGERSHRTNKAEFYPLLKYKDDVDLEKNLRWGGALTRTTDHPARKKRKRHTRC